MAEVERWITYQGRRIPITVPQGRKAPSRVQPGWVILAGPTTDESKVKRALRSVGHGYKLGTRPARAIQMFGQPDSLYAVGRAPFPTLWIVHPRLPASDPQAALERAAAELKAEVAKLATAAEIRQWAERAASTGGPEVDPGYPGAWHGLRGDALVLELQFRPDEEWIGGHKIGISPGAKKQIR